MLRQQRNSQLVLLTTAPKRFGGCLLQTGQGFTEYIAMLALIAVAAIGSASYFGQVIRGVKSFVEDELKGGRNSSAELAKARAAALCAEAETRVVTLGTYGSKDQPCVASLTLAIPPTPALPAPAPAPPAPVPPIYVPEPPAPPVTTLPYYPPPSSPPPHDCRNNWYGCAFYYRY